MSAQWGCPRRVSAQGKFSLGVWSGQGCVSRGVYTPLDTELDTPCPIGCWDTPPPVDRHTLVKILPCPKLRLLVVKIKNVKICQGHETSYVSENSKRESNFLIEQFFSLTVSVSRKLPRDSSGLKPGQFWFRRTSTQMSLGVFFSFYHPHSSLREGNVFSPVCLSVCSRRSGSIQICSLALPSRPAPSELVQTCSLVHP